MRAQIALLYLSAITKAASALAERGTIPVNLAAVADIADRVDGRPVAMVETTGPLV